MVKIAIIGANESINVLIEKAKQRGYETHVFAWRVGDIGERTADYFYPISIDDKEQILEECRRIKPNAVISITSDFAVNTVNYVARNLNLPCNSSRTDIVARNKYEMRCALRNAGLYVPWFKKVRSIDDLKIDEIPQFPIIIKPVDMWSNKGVTSVTNPKDINSAIMRAIEASIDGTCIVEEFMEGPEYSCECISYKGKHKILAFTKKHTSGPPYFVEIGHDQPSDLPSNRLSEIERIMYSALDALDIKNSAAHIEFRVLPSGEIGIIEIGARVGGDYIGTDLVQLSTGIDYIGAVLDVALGIAPNLEVNAERQRACVRFFITQKDVNLYKKRELQYPHSIKKVGGELKACTEVVRDGTMRAGYYIYTGEDM